ncbi:MAG: ECF transporter S component [Clostridiales bacterium]|nr:ECF transporter S component [Clostridiales bacterium]
MEKIWAAISLAIVALCILLVFILYEKRKMSPKEIALIANLAAIAGLSRVPFAGAPGVQPTSFFVIVSGYVMGPMVGFLVGALAAVSSNIFLGQGPWTLWQMLCWGLMGVVAGLYKKISKNKRQSRLILIIIGGIWGYLFGIIMNIWHWLAFVYPLNFKSFLASYSVNFWFDTLHAMVNMLFLYYMGPYVIRVLERYYRRLKTYELPVEDL